jgi:hypothetical protein
VELEERTATLEEKLEAIREAFEYIERQRCGLFSDALTKVVGILLKETRE